jgi:ssDNA-binding Zn-finger/Zn-ribbon topoisomerase 1
MNKDRNEDQKNFHREKVLKKEGLNPDITSLKSNRVYTRNFTSKQKFGGASPVFPIDADGVVGDPLCPRCKRKMIKRVAKQGKNKGNKFWGCSGFSRGCNQTFEINDK